MPAATDEVESFDANIIGLVEAQRRQMPSYDPQFWQHRFPDYSVEATRLGMVFLVRGTIHDRGYEKLDRGSHVRWWDVEVAGRPLRAFLVDIASNPRQSRHAALSRLRALVESSGDRPVLILGDFNTPLGAPSLTGLQQAGLRPAVLEKGHGYRCTWPAPLPLLTLDQLWVNSQVAVHNAVTGWSWNSDHRPISAVVTIGTTAPADAGRTASP